MRSMDDVHAAEFTQHRPHLLAVAYRLTGSVADAEDAAQEAWLRLAGLDEDRREQVRDLGAWLTTVVARICLDRLHSAAARRERYVGQWLPEPIVTPTAEDPGRAGSANPLAAAVHDEGLRMAAMVVLDTLTPQQRVALVLHDAFDVPFADIADVLGCSAAAARQYASRGRKALAEADPPGRAGPDERAEVLRRFTAAVRSGDLREVTEILHPDVVFVGDGGGKARTAPQVVAGAARVGRLFEGLLRTYGPEILAAAEPVLVNGEAGVYVPARPGAEGRRRLDTHVQALAIRHGRVTAVYDVANPDKLSHLPADRQASEPDTPHRR